MDKTVLAEREYLTIFHDVQKRVEHYVPVVFKKTLKTFIVYNFMDLVKITDF